MIHFQSVFFYCSRIGISFNSWRYRIFNLTNDDLTNKIPQNSLGVYSLYCDHSNWKRSDEIMNFWNSVNEGYLEMMEYN